MRLPRVRLTVRAMMIAVVIVALMLGGESVRRRWAYFRERATTHALAERAYRRYLDLHRHRVLMGEREARRRSAAGHPHRPGLVLFEPFPVESSYPDVLADRLEEQRGLVERYSVAVGYHAAMRVKYERAERHPWRSVEPDPQAPE
jgi:hypothetical protein